MPGLVPGMSVFYRPCDQDVDGRNKSGHDAGIFVMHDIKCIRDNPDAFDAALKRRRPEPQSSSLLAIDEKRRAAIMASEQALARSNSASKEICDAKKTKDDARATKPMAEIAELTSTLTQL